ncbi:MAG TPA: bifunctional phosphoribosyl-AMP cyclohydrolase/phosphoribosyl-ATP diphosphatase HisIE [Clostridia bacterium]|nr:bifunctional phosphoribosyl-AMP cyclohydrolase/phosphoribosyl-ATP diphosphatase HisIE [Clostridia bacterium]
MPLQESLPGFIDNLKFDSQGLIPAIVQEEQTGQVLMLAYMNKESLEKTLQTGRTCFFSRSRQQLWVKGETSGDFQEVVSIDYDCDADALLIKVIQQGNACHTGAHSCFFNQAAADPALLPQQKAKNIVSELYQVIRERYEQRPEGSYTTYLFNEGRDKILKKVGEEATEVIIGSKNDSPEEIRYEMADLMYHCMVLLVHHGMKPEDVLEELAKRR